LEDPWRVFVHNVKGLTELVLPGISWGFESSGADQLGGQHLDFL